MDVSGIAIMGAETPLPRREIRDSGWQSLPPIDPEISEHKPR
jgi:hypothetical protein